MSTYTPMELEIICRLAAALRGSGAPVRSLRVFGSRARGHSTDQSDLDIAVDLESLPDPGLTRRVMDLARGLSLAPGSGDLGLRVQLVPFFEGEEQTPLARAIARDAVTVWTRT